MRKFTIKATYSIAGADWNKVKLTHLPNTTHNYGISPHIFARECEEYDNGTLPNEHDLYLGERYG